MKPVLLILYFCLSAAALRNPDLAARGSPSKSPPASPKRLNSNELKSPFLPDRPMKPPHNGSAGKATVSAGPNQPGSAMGSRGHTEKATLKDTKPGKSRSVEREDGRRTKVGGVVGKGGKIEAETTANEVRVKMNIVPPAFGIINRLKPDGAWSEQLVSNKGRTKKYFKNEDGPVTVKSRILGGGRLRSTGDDDSWWSRAGKKFVTEE